MLGGWYCRSMANQQSSGGPLHEQDDDDLEAADVGGGGTTGDGAEVLGGGGAGDSASEEDESQAVTMSQNAAVDYRAHYSGLKKKLKFLLYENEFFQDALRSSQRRLLKVTRDRSFLLDRLVQYEKTEATTSESDDTETSDDEAHRDPKRRKQEQSTPATTVAAPSLATTPAAYPQAPQSQTVFLTLANSPKQPPSLANKQRKKQMPPKRLAATAALTTTLPRQQSSTSGAAITSFQSDGHMTAEEVERHLQSRQSLMELVPERAPPTVPTEMFSNEPSLDSESNDQLEASPVDIGGEEGLSVDY